METKKYYLPFSLAVILGFLPFFFGGCMEERTQIEVREDTTARSLPHAEDDSKYCIYLITMDQVSDYWRHIDAGCRKAVRELGNVDYHWSAPPMNDIEEQRQIIQQAVMDGAEAILLSASSPTELNDVLDQVTAAGIKLIYVDSSADHAALASLVTDNAAAGRTAGKTMQRALAEAGIQKGTIGLVVGSSRGRNASLRSQGFREAFEGTAFTIAPNVAQNGNRINIENEVRNHPEYVAFFGANEQVTRILCEQIRMSGSKQIIVGFDTSDFTLSMIQKGVLYASMQQNTEKMGYDGIVIAVAALKGEAVGTNAETDMGVNVITRDRL